MESRRFQFRRVHRAGASVQVTIPRDLAQAVGIAQGDQVYVYLVGRVICLKRVDEGGFQPEVVALRAGPVGERIG